MAGPADSFPDACAGGDLGVRMSAYAALQSRASELQFSLKNIARKGFWAALAEAARSRSLCGSRARQVQRPRGQPRAPNVCGRLKPTLEAHTPFRAWAPEFSIFEILAIIVFAIE
jgi:hypothetical protein